MQDFRGLRVLKKAHELTLEIYRVTRRFPSEERYGLTAQVRRSASSIASNIAEGCGRRTDADFCRFLHVAMGSASELEYQLLLAHDLGLLGSREYRVHSQSVVEVKRMLTSLIRKPIADSR